MERIGECLYEVPTSYRADMRVPARIFADEAHLPALMRDSSIDQLVNVTTLPGIEIAAMGMPDMHQGYGFPVGGVAGMRMSDGVVSPGGIGYDINCGVRLLTSGIERRDLQSSLEPLVHEISRSVPHGYGHGGKKALSDAEMVRVLEEGCPYVVREHGLGTEADLEVIESGGCLKEADAKAVSDRAKLRGKDQLGTLGGGNHFLEVQEIDEIFDEEAAKRLGLVKGQVTLLIHSGSRGLGHQVCTDYVKLMDAAGRRAGIVLPDRQLACAPISSPEGKKYFAAMCAAANFGWSNRQVIAHRVREAFKRILGAGATLKLVYDVGHNNAKVERYKGKDLLVHRKGATRALGPSSREIPDVYKGLGQPVFIPGSMGTASFVLLGTDASRELSLSSTCHGAGRSLSRTAAKQQVKGHELRKELESMGIVVRCPSNAELAEEAPMAYKDVDAVVDIVSRAGIARKVARLRPIGVVKG